MFITQRLKAPNDTNGNPRRLYVVYELVKETSSDRHYADIAAVVDEGYSGRRALPSKYLDEPALSEISITPAEYKAWMAYGKELARK